HGEFRPFNSTNITEWDVQLGLLRCPSGATEAAFGAATGTVRVAGGAVENTSNGAAVGTTQAVTSPSTRSWVLTGLGGTNDTIFTLSNGSGTAWTINGPI